MFLQLLSVRTETEQSHHSLDWIYLRFARLMILRIKAPAASAFLDAGLNTQQGDVMAPSCSYVIPIHFSSSTCVVFSPSASFKETKPALLYSHRCKRHNGYLAARDPVFISNVEQSKGDPSSSHFPPFERQTFYSGGALSSRPAGSRAGVIILESSFAIKAAHALSIFCWNSVHGR